MLRASWKSLMARKLRLFMSAFAIILGVAFVAGSFVFTDTLGRSFDSIMNEHASATSSCGRSPASSDLEEQPVDRDPARAPSSSALASTPGAARADGNITNFGTFVVGKNGKLIGGFGPPGLGLNFTGGPAAKGLQPLDASTVGRLARRARRGRPRREDRRQGRLPRRREGQHRQLGLAAPASRPGSSASRRWTAASPAPA